MDYRNIPWRNSRFDEEELTRHFATQSRARNALEQLDKRGGTRILAFCASQRHEPKPAAPEENEQAVRKTDNSWASNWTTYERA